MTTAICLAGAASFIVSLILTRCVMAVAPRFGFVDKPGHRKIHANPKPLGGGIAITLSLLGVLAVGVAIGLSTSTDSGELALQQGLRQQMPLAIGFAAAMLAMHVMGLIDDRRALGAYVKLIVQLLVVGSFVIGMEFFAQETPSLRLRALTYLDQFGAGPWPSIAVTVLWIVAITNAFNFLDNMDGLSAGVAAVCTAAFLATALTIEQWFVAALLATLLGSLLGFLVWNFPPARLFMGDSGSLVIGFVLGVMTVRTTYLAPGNALQASWYATLVPVVVL
ncbi:MAG TPA: MraY family glycosyltransferase, partial [Tepidisphaeraceae bacterium]